MLVSGLDIKCLTLRYYFGGGSHVDVGIIDWNLFKIQVLLYISVVDELLQLY